MKERESTYILLYKIMSLEDFLNNLLKDQRDLNPEIIQAVNDNIKELLA